MTDWTENQRCSRCKHWFPATTEHFYKGVSKYGLSHDCRECHKQTAKEYHNKRKLAAKQTAERTAALRAKIEKFGVGA